jgi:hypothetical protein
MHELQPNQTRTNAAIMLHKNLSKDAEPVMFDSKGGGEALNAWLSILLSILLDVAGLTMFEKIAAMR